MIIIIILNFSSKKKMIIIKKNDLYVYKYKTIIPHFIDINRHNRFKVCLDITYFVKNWKKN